MDRKSARISKALVFPRAMEGERRLDYLVEGWSSFTASHHPSHVLSDTPALQARWVSASTVYPQYLLLRLQAPAIVSAIRFGKYHKLHQGNLKDFRVLGGMEKEPTTELTAGMLRNDSDAEIFHLSGTVCGRTMEIPCLYIKVIPLTTWKPNNNFSIWHIGLFGYCVPEQVNRAIAELSRLREQESLRLTLKFLRAKGMNEAFETLQKEAGVNLEHADIAALRSAIVDHGDYHKCELLLSAAERGGLFNEYAYTAANCKIAWRRLDTPPLEMPPPPPPALPPNSASVVVAPPAAALPSSASALLAAPAYVPMPSVAAVASLPVSVISPAASLSSSRLDEPLRSSSALSSSDTASLPSPSPSPSPPLIASDWPCPRGGHQMILDHVRGFILLFAGWNGSRDVGDLWKYDLAASRWICLSPHCQDNGGPSPRSCHKVCYDVQRGRLYTLGRYVSADSSAADLQCDFWMYDVESNAWTLLSPDVHAVGGPTAIYDHQLCLDPHQQIIYIFGGRSVVAAGQPHVEPYSGLYSYNINSQLWRRLLSDRDQFGGKAALPSRMGHSMIYSQRLNALLIFAGQRNASYLSDLYLYRCATGEIEDLMRDASRHGGPEPGFTQRATWDEETQELYVLSGLMRDRTSGMDVVHNSFWLFSFPLRRWRMLYRNENTGRDYWMARQHIEPVPRYANQLVLNPTTGVHYLFGGNPGPSEPLATTRLNDFWTLTVKRPATKEVLAKAIFYVRAQQLRELCTSAPIEETLQYLQGPLREALNTDDEEQYSQFQSLSLDLVMQSPISLHPSRVELFDALQAYYPAAMRGPAGSLEQLVK